MNDAVLLPEDRKCSRRNATPERSTSGAGAFCGALMTHGLDDGLYGFCAWTSLRDGVIQSMPQWSDVMRNSGRRVAELVRPSMFFGALIALDTLENMCKGWAETLTRSFRHSARI